MTDKNMFKARNCAKVVGIQFSVMSPAEIRKGSVAEITSRDTYVNNKPVVGGVFDLRMGTIERGYTCPTDGLGYMQTPGYFGHINLAVPVFYIQYLSIVQKIVKCICYKCGKLRMSKSKHPNVLVMSAEDRWKYVSAIASKIKRCGEDTYDGCGCLQPIKIKKEGFATLIAVWKQSSNAADAEKAPTVILTPSLVLKIFSRISDDDISFMGFSPLWARPEWFICQVLAVPPPAVRPSVKQESQQRSEDDLTHLIIHILKTNKTVLEKIQKGEKLEIINDWAMLLQYYVACQVDNKISNANPVAQRSGRPLKSIKDRLTGKGGRMRGNLMAKRVDFSARSVITADPNISIKELGIPMKIAKNITKPVIVNTANHDFLMKLVQNGPEVYPGAKMLERKNGTTISLKTVDRESLTIENGDTVHRHMMDGDPILFNRQPTLHRMSMMCHIARIMTKGDTFRMNVADTKPYNADFDGDEMNLHMPQDAESESELKNLAAVPYQIISPGNNAAIIGIYQDSMLGSYQFTRKDSTFSRHEAMNLLMMLSNIDVQKLTNPSISNFEIISQILPSMSLKNENKQFNRETENVRSSNNVVEIINGEYIRGQMDKGILGSGTKGMIHRICNDYDNMRSSQFIDDLQNIITAFMKNSSFSVGISDLISNDRTSAQIVDVINQKQKGVYDLIDQVRMGILDNNSGKTNREEFETRVNNVLNQATSEAGKIGLNNLNKGNRFVTMVNAGSKGSELNISQMISCIGQQNVDGKRIPCGFDNRTLPHYVKYDDSPEARGFVRNSYINGLDPQEFFFHAMGGRVGLIDTAVKTSSTGYIQRRLIKAMEDLKVHYDGTVRNNKNVIVEYKYGDDAVDGIRVENQEIPLVAMSIQDVYSHYNIPADSPTHKQLTLMFTKPTMSRYKEQQEDMNIFCKKYTDYMLEMRDLIVNNVFKGKSDKIVRAPVALSFIIDNIKGQQNINANHMVDITPLEVFEMIEYGMARLDKLHYAKPTELFRVLYYFNLSPKNLLFNKRYNRQSVELLIETIVLKYKQALVAPGEMVGMIAAQSIGEPTTQMSCLGTESVRIGYFNTKTGENCIKTHTMGKLCDELISELPDKTKNTSYENSVETDITDLHTERYIIGVNEKEEVRWNKISCVSRHPVNGDLVKVTTRSGRSVITTLSHSHLIRQENMVVPIEGSKLEVGMSIPVVKEIPRFEENPLESKTTIFIENEPLELTIMVAWFIVNFILYGRLTEDKCKIRYKGYPNKNSICFSTMNVFKLGIGSITITTDCDGLEEIEFSIPPHISNFISESFYNNTTAEICIPDFVFNADEQFIILVIQILFDLQETFIANHNEKANIRLVATIPSHRIQCDIGNLLSRVGIFTEFSQDDRGYQIVIPVEYVNRYTEIINSFTFSEFIQEFKTIAEETINSNTFSSCDNFENGIKESIKTCFELIENSNVKLEENKNIDSVSRNLLSSIVEKLTHWAVNIRKGSEQIFESNLAILQQALNAGIVWDKIISVQVYTPDQSTFVYDFTVPGNQTFMVDCGILVHNTLNTFHFAGVSSKSNVTRGVPRIEEILSLSSKMKNPSLTVFLNVEDEQSKEKTSSIAHMLERTKLSDVVSSISICFDADDLNTLIKDDQSTLEQYEEFENLVNKCGATSVVDDADIEKSKWLVRIILDPELMLDKNITPDDIQFALTNMYKNEISCTYSDYNSDKLVFRIRMNTIIKGSKSKSGGKKKDMPLDQTDQIHLFKAFQESLMNDVVLRGVNDVNNVLLRKIKDTVVEKEGSYKQQEIWVIDTIGTNLIGVLGVQYIDSTRTVSNDIIEIHNVLGVEAARATIYNELADVIEFDGTYLNYRHMSLLCDRMTYTGGHISIFRHGINLDDTGPIAKASFEETPEMFLKAARHGALDTMRGVSANVMCGQEGFFGTSAFQILLDTNEMQKLSESVKFEPKRNDRELIDGLMGDLDDVDDVDNICSSISKLKINNNVVNLRGENMGDDDKDYNPFA